MSLYNLNQGILLKHLKFQFYILPLFFTIIFCVINSCVREHPNIHKAQDKTYYIALDSLPNSWKIKWSVDKDSVERLKVISPQNDVTMRVFVLKSSLYTTYEFAKSFTEIDTSIAKEYFKEFLSIDKLFFGRDPHIPYDTLYVKQYERKVIRHLYLRKVKPGFIINTSVDDIKSQEEKGFTYAVVLDYIDKSDPDIDFVRSKLHFYTPHITAIGRFVENTRRPDFSISELIIAILALLSFLAGAIWGLFAILNLISDASRKTKLIAICISLATGPIAMHIWGLHWSSLLWVPIVFLLVIGLFMALGSGAEIE